MKHRVAAVFLALGALAVSGPAAAEPNGGRTRATAALSARLIDLDARRGRPAPTLELEAAPAAGSAVQSVAPALSSTRYAASLVITSKPSSNARSVLSPGAERWLDRPTLDPTIAASSTPLRILEGISVPTGAQNLIIVRPTASVDLSTLGLLARGSF